MAHMKHLNILHECYIYPKEQRSVRYLLRRRLFFVRHRTANILSLQRTITRNLGIKISGNNIKKLNMDDANELFDSSNLVFMVQNNISAIKHLGEIIKGIEKEVKSQVQLCKEFVMLLTIPEIGIILGLTIMLEVGDIGRFSKIGNYSSYCCCVSSKRLSNGKKKGENNKNHMVSCSFEGVFHFII